jgi:1,4-alpha-glucan branching enzyme
VPIAPGILRIPAPSAPLVEMRFAPIAARDQFDPPGWQRVPLTPAPGSIGFFEVSVNTLGLDDGAYEYEFILDGRMDQPIPDPYADEITRFGGYRGIFRIANGRRSPSQFSWADEIPAGGRLPNNNEIVVYEMPLRWMSTGGDDAGFRQVDLGSFESVIFQHLSDLAALGVNTIELLPVEDSPDTLNWGYGTRFFFAPDLDMGVPTDLKLFMKLCHRRGIRVFLDVVMNHSAGQCPLVALADDVYYLPIEGPGRWEEGDRPGYGGRIFRYARPAPDGAHPAREFHYRMAEFWVREYHVDGFRIDEFKGINNWEFVQTFRERAWAEHDRLFPGRPFLVIAEDSWRRAVITVDDPDNPHGRKVVDAMWNFAYRDDLRRLMRDGIETHWGQPSRSERVRALVTGSGAWDDLKQSMSAGFDDMARMVNYVTSHDVEKQSEERFLNETLGRLLVMGGLGDGSVAAVRSVVDGDDDDADGKRAMRDQAHQEALDCTHAAFAILLTSAGIPMFLAGEEFGDVHDLDNGDWRLKMSDPVDWNRLRRPGHQALRDRVSELIRLRTTHPALQRNETEFFYFHPAFDDNDGERVFAYCRTNASPLGSQRQIVVVANAGQQSFAEFWFPWPWTETDRLREVAVPASAGPPRFLSHERRVTIPLGAHQTRVFTT